MLDTKPPYTTQLQAGLGLIEETLELLDLWEPGMPTATLAQEALESGRFNNVTARRLRNIVQEMFAPRYLVEEGKPADWLKRLKDSIARREISQLFLIYTARANPILADFVAQVYWPAYSGGSTYLDTEIAAEFVERGLDHGLMEKRWSETTVRRVSSYLLGCCADYGLLETGRKSSRKITPISIARRTALFLAYELHFAGRSDTGVLDHENWMLFGLEKADVVAELQRVAKEGHIIVQYSGELLRVSWKHKSMEEVLDVIA